MGQGQAQAGSNWLLYVFLTVFSWGVYGVYLHKGRSFMGDPANGGFKAFLFVGVAYFLVAILAPLAVLLARGATWTMPADGIKWSLIAGIVGAVGAFGALVALSLTKGNPAVMSIIFAGAPIVNAFASMYYYPPEGGVSAIKPQFWLGLVLAATGGFLVSMYRPQPNQASHAKPAATAVRDATATEANAR